MISQLLWVCGPGGAGKSAFLRQLAAGQLPAHIVDRLPAGCESWAQLKAKDLHFFDARSLPSEFAVHYSLTQALRHFSNFKNDSVLQLFRLAKHITVVHVKPTEERLSRQRSHRRSCNRKPKPSAMSLKLRRMRTQLARIMGVGSASASFEDAWQARKRKSPHCDEVAPCLYKGWEDHLHQEMCYDRPITELFLQPDPASAPGDVRWTESASAEGRVKVDAVLRRMDKKNETELTPQLRDRLRAVRRIDGGAAAPATALCLVSK
jgi:hypothetical protein